MKILSTVLLAVLVTVGPACKSDPASCAEPTGIWEMRGVTTAGDCGFPADGVSIVDHSEPDTPDDPECTGHDTTSADLCTEEINQRCPERDNNGVITGWVETIGTASAVSATRTEGTVQFTLDDANGNQMASCVVEFTWTKL
jgi:hypothetical protein